MCASLSSAINIPITAIHYKGASQNQVDIIAGRIHLAGGTLFNALPQIKAGKLRPIALTSAKRSSSLPDVPTVAESGYKDFDVSTWYGVFAPAGTPAAIVTTLNTEINKLLAKNEMKAAIHAQGAEPDAMTPARFAEMFRADHARWKSIVEQSGATVD